MKKWIIAALVILIFLFSCIYIFIPSTMVLSRGTVVNVSISSAFRYMSDESKWKLWWPGRNLVYDGYTYSLKDIIYNTIKTDIKKNNSTTGSAIELTQLATDTVQLQWVCTIKTSLNPVKRLLQYKRAVHLRENIGELLQAFRAFVEKKENVYGMDIVQASTVDTVLISTKKIFAVSPTTPEIYALIKNLQDYISRQHAKQTGNPMLNIGKADAGGIQVMVAVPTDRILPKQGDINYKIMIPGNFMVAEVKGGASTVSHALDQLRLYTDDYKRTVMAIPFEILVTDRMKEKDTLKWITKLYIPVE